MKIVFMGTPEFAAVALEALLRAGHAVALVLTQPDRPAGRGLKTRLSAVKRTASAHGLHILQPSTLRNPEVVDSVARHTPDALVVAAYGLIVPQAMLDVARLGGLNIHASLLPRWRGAAPIQRAILAGDAVTGVTIMSMSAGLDTGPILLQETVPIRNEDTARSLHDTLAGVGGRLIVQALAAPLSPRPQNEAAATYAAKIERREARIDWNESAAAIHRKIRAFDPVPGAYSSLAGTEIKIWRAEIAPGIAAAPGTVLQADAAGIIVACGGDGLRVMELQRSSGRRVSARAFMAGSALARGAHFV